jgi:hypothetical protein
LPTYVSGHKNKMGFCHLSTNCNKNSNVRTEDNLLKNVSREFLYWFSGFTDAEGNFLISIDRQYVRFRFKISLHIDDVEVVNTIKSNLNVGTVTLESSRNRCSYIIQNYEEIKNVICPIFNAFPLHTSKRLDFENFSKAVLIKGNKKLSDTDMSKIVSLKNTMNTKREIFTYNTTKSQIIINPNWFIGFIEGEGTFGIKTGSALYLQVSQKKTSQESLNAITTFLTGLSNNVIQNSKILPLNVINTTNVRTDVVSLVVNSVDSLYYYLLPLLDTSKMYSRKAIDFNLWRVALLLKIKGYYYLPEGKTLFLDISDILNKRYSTNTTKNISEIMDNIYKRSKTIFEKDPPFDVKSNTPHSDNVRKFSIQNRSDNPKVVYIYTNKGMIKGSPFVSYSSAHKALGLNPSSNTCNRYIDTGRLYKNNFIFSSKPIDSASRD